MKKKISLLLAILMLVTLLPTAFAESKTADARKTSQKITLDGQAVDIGAYNIEGHNYVKLRDVAAIMTAKKSQFNVGYDAEKNLVIVETDKPYTKEAGDLAAIKDAKAKAVLEVKKIMVNGEAKDIKTALIKGNNYMQLRDLGRLVGFGVGYDAKNKTIVLKSDGKVEEKEEKPVEEKKEASKSDEDKLKLAKELYDAYVREDIPKLEKIYRDIYGNDSFKGFFDKNEDKDGYLDLFEINTQETGVDYHKEYKDIKKTEVKYNDTDIVSYNFNYDNVKSMEALFVKGDKGTINDVRFGPAVVVDDAYLKKMEENNHDASSLYKMFDALLKDDYKAFAKAYFKSDDMLFTEDDTVEEIEQYYKETFDKVQSFIKRTGFDLKSAVRVKTIIKKLEYPTVTQVFYKDKNGHTFVHEFDGFMKVDYRYGTF